MRISKCAILRMLLLSAFLGTITLPAQNQKWQTLPGSAIDLAIGADGSLWVIGTEMHEFGADVFKWDAANWTWEKSAGGTGIRIAVDPQGIPWVVNNKGLIFRKRGKGWQQMPGSARDIGIGANGAVWVVGTDEQDVGGFVYLWDEANWKWDKSNGVGVRIAVDPKGIPWIINKKGLIFRKMGASWQQLPGSAVDIAISAKGDVWVTGTDKLDKGGPIYKWDEEKWSWEKVSGSAQAIAVNPAGKPCVINSDHKILLEN